MSDELLAAADMLWRASDALMKAKSTWEELKLAKDVKAALSLYAEERNRTE